MTAIVFGIVALVAVGLTYDIARRMVGTASRAEFLALRAEVTKLTETVQTNEKFVNDVCIAWRKEVLDLHQKTDRVVRDANNEIAASVASVTAIGEKGWR